MRVAFIGCVDFSKAALELLCSIDGISICGVMTRRKSPFNADFFCLGAISESLEIDTFYADECPKEEQTRFFQMVKPDIIYCFGWSYLLPQELLDIPLLGVIGYHPALLPLNRGRHPIIWALVRGLNETASTFFKMDATADSGPIVSQVTVPILDTDDAQSLYDSLIKISMDQIVAFTKGFLTNTQILVEQDHLKANVWRKRSAKDGMIDWRMSARSIYNLVRALRPPYPGAEASINGTLAKIWSVKVNTTWPENLEPGKVLKNSDGKVIVKCGEDSIEILEHSIKNFPQKGKYL